MSSGQMRVNPSGSSSFHNPRERLQQILAASLSSASQQNPQSNPAKPLSSTSTQEDGRRQHTQHQTPSHPLSTFDHPSALPSLSDDDVTEFDTDATLHHLSTTKQTLDTLHREVTDLSAENNHLSLLLSSVSTRLQAETKAKEEAEQRCIDLRHQVSSLQQAQHLQLHQRKEVEAKLCRLQEECQALQHRYDSVVDKLQHEVSLLEALQSAHQSLQSNHQLLQSNHQSLQQAHDDLSLSHQQEIEKSKSLESEVQSCRHEASSIDAQLLSSQFQYKLLQSKYQSLETEVDQLQQQLHDSNKQVEATQQNLHSVQSSLSHYLATHDPVTVAALQEEKRVLSTTISTLVKNQHTNQLEKQAIEEMSNEMRDALNRVKGRLSKVVSRVEDDGWWEGHDAKTGPQSFQKSTTDDLTQGLADAITDQHRKASDPLKIKPWELQSNKDMTDDFINTQSPKLTLRSILKSTEKKQQERDEERKSEMRRTRFSFMNETVGARDHDDFSDPGE